MLQPPVLINSYVNTLKNLARKVRMKSAIASIKGSKNRQIGKTQLVTLRERGWDGWIFCDRWFLAGFAKE